MGLIWRAFAPDSLAEVKRPVVVTRSNFLKDKVAFPVRLSRAPAATRGRLQFLDALPHRGSFFVGESLGRLAPGAYTCAFLVIGEFLGKKSRELRQPRLKIPFELKITQTQLQVTEQAYSSASFICKLHTLLLV